MTPEKLYAQQQQYSGNGIAQAVANARQAKANNNADAAIPIIENAPSQVVSQLSQMNAESAYKSKMADRAAIEGRRDAMLDAREAKLNAAAGYVPGQAPASGLGGNVLNEAAIVNSAGDTGVVINGKSGPGTRNQVKNVILNSNDPFAPSIRRVANENLKYSQGRGKGCTDCSAYTQRIYKETTGKNIGGNTESQWKTGKSINLNNAKNGDLVFFKSPKSKYKNRNVTHVGKYNGDGTMTHFGTGGLKTVPLKGYSLPMVGFKRYV